MSLFTQILTGFFLLREHLAFLASKSWSNSVQTIQKKWGSNIVIIVIKTVWIVFVFDACHSNCECIICWISITEHLNIFLTVWLLQITVHAKLSINRARPTPILKWQWMFFSGTSWCFTSLLNKNNQNSRSFYQYAIKNYSCSKLQNCWHICVPVAYQLEVAVCLCL